MKQSTSFAQVATNLLNVLQGYTKGIRFLAVLTMLLTLGAANAWGATYTKVTSAPSDWSGEYLIVYETGKVAFNGSLTTLDAASNTVSVTIKNNSITSTENSITGATFIIAKSGTSYTIQSQSGYYIGQTADDNGLKSNKTTTYSHTISFNNDGTVNLVSGGAYLRYNAASNQYRFRYYKSSSYTNQKAICLYKKGITEPSYSVTIADNIENGEVTANLTSATAGTEIELTATPTNGYQFSSWIVTKEGGGTVEVTNNKFTMPASNVTVSATFTALPKYTVNWYVNGSKEDSQADVAGAILTNIPNLEDYECGGKVFVGWTTQSSYEHATNAPDDLITSTDGMTIPENGEDYYAVFATLTGFDGNINFATQGWKNGEDLDIDESTKVERIFDIGGVTLQFFKGDGSYAPQYFTTGAAVRLYAKNQMTVSASSNIESITFTHASGEDANTISCSSGYFSGTKWTGNTNSVTFTIGGTTGHRRIAAINVQIAGGGNGTYSDYTTSCVPTYTITWNNWDGTLLGTSTVVEGKTPTYTGETPTREADEENTYTFKGWTPNVTSATGNATYTATYTATVNKYTITWKNEDGTVLETDSEVEYGTMPTYDGSTPTKAADAQYTYTFNGWSPEVKSVTGNATYTATFTETINQYQVTFNMNDHGDEITAQTVDYGSTAAEPNPTPTADGYKFAGWYKDEQCTIPWNFNTDVVTGITTIYAKWLQIFTITWKANGLEYTTTKVTEGEPITPPASPDAGDYCGQVFAGWTDAEMVETTNGAPTLYPTSTPFPTATKETPTTFYAVFADYGN